MNQPKIDLHIEELILRDVPYALRHRIALKRPVALVEIDAIGLQSVQAGVAFFANRFGPKIVRDLNRLAALPNDAEFSRQKN